MLVDPATKTKECTQCKRALDLGHYFNNGKRGLHSWCKDCLNENAKKRYDARSVEKPRVSEKFCPRCQETKSATNFSTSIKQPSGLKSWCRECDKEAKVVKYHSIEEKDRKLRQTFNMTLEEYKAMLKDQNYVCAICKKPCTRNLAVDHDHSCCSSGSCGNCVRGLLCKHCNMMLGIINDDVDILKSAIAYLGGE